MKKGERNLHYNGLRPRKIAGEESVICKNFLLSGLPGSGKTTVITALAHLLGDQASGFFTREIRVNGQRQGFEVVTLSGKRAVLAHVDSSSRYRVGKYGVNPENLTKAIEEIGQAIVEDKPKCLLIDEIGKMELLAPSFLQTVLLALDSSLPVVAAILAKPHPFCDVLKSRPDVKLIQVNQKNRGRLPEELYNSVILYLERL